MNHRPGAATGAWPHSLRSLQSQAYRRYWAGNLVSVGGQWMQRVAQDWLVWTLTDSPRALGVTMAFQFMPVLLGALWGGTITDRSDLRRVLLVTQAASACLALLLAALVWADAAQLWVVWLFAALLGLVTVFDNPARHSLIMHMTGEDHVANAVALNSIGHNLGRMIGPAVGGAVVAGLGVGTAFALNALTFMPMVAALYVMAPSPAPAGGAGHGGRRELISALRYVWSLTAVRTSLLLMLVVSVFAQNYRVLLPLLSRDLFGGGATLYGILLALIGVGALLGGLVSMHFERPTLGLILLSAALFGLLSLLVPWSGSVAVVGTVFVLLGAANSVFNISTRSLELLSVDAHYRGRVMALHQMMFVGGAPFGGLLLGQIAEVYGARWGFVTAGSTVLLVLPAVRVLGAPAPAGDPVS